MTTYLISIIRINQHQCFVSQCEIRTLRVNDFSPFSFLTKVIVTFNVTGIKDFSFFIKNININTISVPNYTTSKACIFF